MVGVFDRFFTCVLWGRGVDRVGCKNGFLDKWQVRMQQLSYTDPDT